MATLVVTFNFATTAQSFTATQGASVTCTLDSSFGTPVDSLKSTRPLKALSSANSSWARTLTFTDLGVPSGSTVTGITAASMWSSCTAFTSAGTGNTVGAVTLADGGTTVTLSSQRAISATDTPITAPGTFVQTNGVDSTGLSLPATDTVTITIPNHLSNTNVTGSVVTVYQDKLSFTITYTPPPTRLAGRSNSSINQGLIARYPLKDGSSAMAYDISGNNNHLALGSATSIPMVGTELFQKAPSFAQAGGWFAAPNTNMADFGATDSFSVCFWARYTTTYTQFNSIVAKSVSGTSPFWGWGLGMDQSGGSFGYFTLTDLAGNQALISATRPTPTTSLSSSSTLATGGTSYAAGNVLTLTGGTSQTTAQLTVDTVSSGVVTAFHVSRAGAYSLIPANPISVTGGAGSGFTLTGVWANNPKWHLIAGVLDRTAQLAKISIDGLPFETISSSSVGSIANSSQFVIGFQTIVVHDIRLYGKALSLAEINKIYRNRE